MKFLRLTTLSAITMLSVMCAGCASPAKTGPGPLADFERAAIRLATGRVYAGQDEKAMLREVTPLWREEADGKTIFGFLPVGFEVLNIETYRGTVIAAYYLTDTGDGHVFFDISPNGLKAQSDHLNRQRELAAEVKMK